MNRYFLYHTNDTVVKADIQTLKRILVELENNKEEEEKETEDNKRKVPRHLPYSIKTNELNNQAGEMVKLEKFPRRVGLTLEQFQQRLVAAEKLLTDNKITVSANNLKKIGIGQRSIQCRTGAKPGGTCIINDYSKETK
jgi:hypothetical protein